METKNYWSFYIDFIQYFQSISYRGIPLPLISPFPAYFKRKTLLKINSPKLWKYTISNIDDPIKIQLTFKAFLDMIPHISYEANEDGYTIVCSSLLRIPEDLCSEIFQLDKTIEIIPSSKIKSKEKAKKILTSTPFIPYLLNVSKAKSSVEMTAKQLVGEAKMIFYQLRKHPIFGNRHFRKAFLSDIPEIIRYIESIHDFFDQYPVSHIVVGSTQSILPRTLALIGKQRGIPSICLQHGNIVGDSGYLPIVATKMAVFGEIEREWYLNHGGELEQIEITGHPRFDPIFTSQYLSKEKFHRKLRISPRKKKVLIATSSYSNQKQYFQIAKQIAKDPKVYVILKPHPTEMRKFPGRIDRYARFARRNKRVRLISENMTLYDALQNVDVVVIWSSTVGLEAMLFGKPVVILNQNLPEEYYNASLFSIIKDQIHNDKKSLVKSIRKLVRSKKMVDQVLQTQAEFLKRAYPYQDSTEKVQQLIQTISHSYGHLQS